MTISNTVYSVDLGILPRHCKRLQIRVGCHESTASGAAKLSASHGSWFPQEQNKVEVTDLQNSLRLAQEEAEWNGAKATARTATQTT